MGFGNPASAVDVANTAALAEAIGAAGTILTDDPTGYMFGFSAGGAPPTQFYDVSAFQSYELLLYGASSGRYADVLIEFFLTASAGLPRMNSYYAGWDAGSQAGLVLTDRLTAPFMRISPGLLAKGLTGQLILSHRPADRLRAAAFPSSPGGANNLLDAGQLLAVLTLDLAANASTTVDVNGDTMTLGPACGPVSIKAYGPAGGTINLDPVGAPAGTPYANGRLPIPTTGTPAVAETIVLPPIPYQVTCQCGSTPGHFRIVATAAPD